MYKSPIEIITTQLQTQILKQQENDVYRTVQKVGINVDKDELIKALQYDRDQYQKGYRDGMKEFADRLLKLDPEIISKVVSFDLDELNDLLKETGAEL